MTRSRIMCGERQPYRAKGEVIKMIHGELPAVRWTCGGCGEDSASVFFEPDSPELTVECEYCAAENLVVREPD